MRGSLAFQLGADGYDVHAYESAEVFLDAAAPPWRGCVITDVRLPGLDGIALIETLTCRGCPLPVVVVTGLGDVPLAVRAMQAGATDFLEKPVLPEALERAVSRALSGLGSAAALRREAASLATRLATLSRRERDVFDGLVTGALGKQVAGRLGISPRTVEVYRAKMMEKLGIQTSAELQRLGLLHALFGPGGEDRG